MTEGQIRLTRRECIVIGHAAVKKTLNTVQELLYQSKTETRAKQQRYLSARIQLAHLKAKHTSFSGSFGRQRSSRKASAKK
jgi:hypothetical protein